MKKDFIVELGTEELPPKALEKLAKAFLDGITQGLEKSSLGYSEAKYFGAPRRLAVLIHDLDSKQQDRVVEKRGPALKAAFKEDGCPTPAAEGFAKSCGTSVDKLETMETDKGAWLMFKQEQKGASSADIVPDIVVQSLNRLPVPKRMRWADNDHEFVRPVHWLLMLHGNEILPCSMFGHQSGNITIGHRFHHPDSITIPNPSDYRNLLESQGKVIVDFQQRKDIIRAQVEEAAKDIEGIAVIDEDLLTEVTGLAEWPQAIVGKFDKAFLDVPAEALISAMKGHQKYFHVVDKSGQLMPYFITIANIESKNTDSVRTGNERVIRPRLSDAEFFWLQDKKHKLVNQLSKLDSVIFQKQLGSLGEKVKRVQKISENLATELQCDTQKAIRAAELSKCDLMSGMVGEFPELQGIMGQYYALHDGEDSDVALALNEQYLPRFSGDELPKTKVGQILAIADKIDTTVGIFGIGQAPTGDKDPFALRRAVLGILRTIVEKELTLDIKNLIHFVYKNYGEALKENDTPNQVYQFILDRSKGYFAEKGIEHDVFESVASLEPAYPSDMAKRLQAIDEFKKLPEAESLAAANKRINNILKKVDSHEIAKSIDKSQLVEEAEKALYQALLAAIEDTKQSVADKNYQETLKRLAQLRSSVDNFFDSVMVMSEKKEQRVNRLTLLKALSDQFMNIADIGRLQI